MTCQNKSPEDQINDLTRQIAQVCVSCPHLRFQGGMLCDRKKSQCHSKRVRAWLKEIADLEKGENKVKHAREDYSRIQDPSGKIPTDEPVFLIRGQDINAPTVVNYWARCAEKSGAARNIVLAAYDQARRMREWQEKHGKKIPDMLEVHK